MLLERERSLADRGTRVFSVLILHRIEGNPLVLDRLSRQLLQRVRATDIVGQLDRDRLAVLLTDTDPVQARTVAGWIDRAVAALKVRIEPTLYVYPSISDADVRANATQDVAKDSDDEPKGKGPIPLGGNGRTPPRAGTSRTCGRSSPSRRRGGSARSTSSSRRSPSSSCSRSSRSSRPRSRSTPPAP